MSVFTTEEIKIVYGDIVKTVEPPLSVEGLKNVAKDLGVKKFKVKCGDSYLTADDFPIEDATTLEIIPVDGWGR